ncbi:uncharacterized protein Z518_02621 [Rhinocladiella mackenziei CBS 650.93]|uniref:Carboxypeptidase n=1 Tax=Rhinocladiella mackenziei CBS 650.93 TaxID=1442369 RepID=A0A0D2G0B7_9EURO|nr:uncharacterized protein Z518_02621 [Rhinocladiella mackenziei CBS 650.93]KIX07967.1 hypothetical protein Z518_02621 [Rhinocladiella mackenziei CBS 650.93]
MQFSVVQLFALLSLSAHTLAFNKRAINAFKRPHDVWSQVLHERAPVPPAHQAHPIQKERRVPPPKSSRKQKRASPYLNANTEKFVVDGTAIPDVNFDIGESYAGLLPISDDPNETRQLFFWFFPSSNPAAANEVTIWFNGGPGCSSLSGLLTENGPFLWQAGTLAPTPNTYSWSNLTNMLWVEQPIGVGYTQGVPNITNEVELGLEFIGFYKQFVDAFGLQNRKVYLTGESYAGYYVPYIADAFITADDTEYYNLAGVGINDPIVGDETIQQQVVISPFVDYWSHLFYLNASLTAAMHDLHDYCNYSSYWDLFFTFPPPSEPFPVLPDPFTSDDSTCDIIDLVYAAALEVNPCFNIYHITDTCPFVYGHLGIVNSGDYLPPGANVYFNRTDVQAAINAPVGTNWMQCTDINVFGNGDNDNETLQDMSLAPAQNEVLQRVIEYTNNTMIGVGNLDFLLVPNGTLFALQNVTWNNAKGFQSYPQGEPFYVPYHPETNLGRASEAGIVGYWGTERGLTFYTVQLSGHELPGYAAGSGYRMLEVLLGRVPNLSTRGDFTTQTGNFTG